VISLTWYFSILALQRSFSWSYEIIFRPVCLSFRVFKTAFDTYQSWWCESWNIYKIIIQYVYNKIIIIRNSILGYSLFIHLLASIRSFKRKNDHLEKLISRWLPWYLFSVSFLFISTEKVPAFRISNSSIRAIATCILSFIGVIGAISASKYTLRFPVMVSAYAFKRGIMDDWITFQFER